MCGIAYVKRKEFGSVRPLIKRYDEQKSRGQEGYGFVAIDDGCVVAYERHEFWSGILPKLMEWKNKAKEILFHHRYPTSTDNIAEQAHPIVVDNPILKSKYYVVHNGVIHNDNEAKKRHEEKGFIYTTEAFQKTVYEFKDGRNVSIESGETKYNDSECVAIEFALWNEGLIENQIDLRGSIALVAMEVERNTEKVIAVHFGHNYGSPLKMWTSGQKFTSYINDIATAEELLSKVFDEEMVTITSESTSSNSISLDEDRIYSYYHQTNTVKIRTVDIGTTSTTTMGYNTSQYSLSSYNEDVGRSNWEKMRGKRHAGVGLHGYDDGYDIDDVLYGEYGINGIEDVPLRGIKSPLQLEALTRKDVSSQPVCDRSKYKDFTSEQLQWEQLALEDKIERLTAEKSYYEELSVSKCVIENGYINVDNTTYAEDEIDEFIDEYEKEINELDGYLQDVTVQLSTTGLVNESLF